MMNQTLFFSCRNYSISNFKLQPEMATDEMEGTSTFEVNVTDISDDFLPYSGHAVDDEIYAVLLKCLVNRKLASSLVSIHGPVYRDIQKLLRETSAVWIQDDLITSSKGEYR